MKIIRPVAVAQTGTLTRASTGTYWDKNGVLQTAVANALRITYYPSDLTKAPYAMVEQASTNLLLYSNDLSQAAWSKSNLSGVGSRTVTGPLGINSAWSVTEDASNGVHEVRTPTITLAAGTVYTQSVYAKAGSRQYVRSGFSAVFNPVASTSYAVFDLLAGTVAYTTGSVITASIQNVGNGWYRCLTTMTVTANTSGTNYIGSQNAAYAPTHQGDGTSNVYICCIQLEGGSTATSYIDTTSATVTRSADTLSGTGLLYSSLAENDYATWNATALYTTGTNVLDLATRSVYQSLTGVSGTSTFAAASAGNVTMLKSDGTTYVPAVNTPVVFTGATMPTGITAGAVYYVQAVTATAFSVAATKGGAAITTGALATATTTVASNNYNTPVSNTTSWLNIGYDNRWDMFDQSITSQSTSNTTITVAILPGQRMDSLVGLNVSATMAKVSLVDTSSGVVAYSASVNLTANSGITDLYGYFYEPIVRLPDFVLDDMPVGPSASGVLVVSFEDANTAKVGGLVLGLSKEIGTTSSSAKVGIIDYSVKTQDAFGNYTITPRAFSKKADFTVQLPSQTVDFVFNLLATYRSTPIVYIGSNSTNDADQYNATVVYGFYKDMSIEIAYKTVSMCTLSVEGLT